MNINLESYQLTIRSLREEDWSFFLNLHQQHNVIEYVFDPMTIQQIEKRFLVSLGGWHKESQRWTYLLIKENHLDHIIGLAGICPHWKINKQAEVGVLLMPAFQNKGYGYKVMQELARFLFDHERFRQLIVSAIDKNVKIKKMLAKTSFHLNKVIPQSYLLSHQLHDDYCYYLNYSDFKKSGNIIKNQRKHNSQKFI